MSPLRACIWAFSIGGCFALSACQSEPELVGRQTAASVEKTDWLPRHQFQKFLTEKDQKDESGKNFWDRGHSIGSIDSRWEDGYQQYKITIVENPKDTAFWWIWYFDMDQSFFQKKLSELSVQGYQLVSCSRSETPSGGESFAAIWNKKGEE